VAVVEVREEEEEEEVEEVEEVAEVVEEVERTSRGRCQLGRRIPAAVPTSSASLYVVEERVGARAD
jgi:hypothetical protein